MISAEMMRAGTTKLRHTKEVRKKTSDYEDKFTSTHTWATATSAGIREQDGEATFNETTTKKFKHYLVLEPI